VTPVRERPQNSGISLKLTGWGSNAQVLNESKDAVETSRTCFALWCPDD
jgi:hypothetical protein